MSDADTIRRMVEAQRRQSFYPNNEQLAALDGLLAEKERLREALLLIDEITADTGIEYSPDHNVICQLVSEQVDAALAAVPEERE